MKVYLVGVLLPFLAGLVHSVATEPRYSPVPGVRACCVRAMSGTTPIIDLPCIIDDLRRPEDWLPALAALSVAPGLGAYFGARVTLLRRARSCFSSTGWRSAFVLIAGLLTGAVALFIGGLLLGGVSRVLQDLIPWYPGDRFFLPYRVGELAAFGLAAYCSARMIASTMAVAPVGVCQKCGYDIRYSLESGRCPECGTAL